VCNYNLEILDELKKKSNSKLNYSAKGSVYISGLEKKNILEYASVKSIERGKE
jgi:hypothetical protein